MSNLRHDMQQKCLHQKHEDGSGKQIKDRHTSKIYRRSIHTFCEWIKDVYGINNIRQLERSGGAVKYIQEYEQKLESEGKSSSTIHTYLAPICKGLGIHLDQIRKPHRVASDMTRSRSCAGNRQGKIESTMAKYERLVDFQKIAGLRRAELTKLKVCNFARDESGYPCIVVERGKGGKAQMQRILPEDLPQAKEFIRKIRGAVESLEDAGRQTRIFTLKEMENKIDLHGLRADHARRAYRVYLKRCDTAEGKAILQKELVARWNTCHDKYEQIKKVGDSYMASSKAGRKFIMEFSAAGKYQLRGANKMRCLATGRPIAYDRTALLAVSVFHLSHWRNDVTVKHYML